MDNYYTSLHFNPKLTPCHPLSRHYTYQKKKYEIHVAAAATTNQAFPGKNTLLELKWLANLMNTILPLEAKRKLDNILGSYTCIKYIRNFILEPNHALPKLHKGAPKKNMGKSCRWIHKIYECIFLGLLMKWKDSLEDEASWEQEVERFSHLCH